MSLEERSQAEELEQTESAAETEKETQISDSERTEEPAQEPLTPEKLEAEEAPAPEPELPPETEPEPVSETEPEAEETPDSTTEPAEAAEPVEAAAEEPAETPESPAQPEEQPAPEAVAPSAQTTAFDDPFGEKQADPFQSASEQDPFYSEDPFAEIRQKMQAQRDAQKQPVETGSVAQVAQQILDNSAKSVRVRRIVAPDVKVAMQVSMDPGQEITPEVVRMVESLSRGVNAEESEETVTVKIRSEKTGESGMETVHVERVAPEPTPVQQAASSVLADQQPAPAPKQPEAKPSEPVQPEKPAEIEPPEPLERRKEGFPVLRLLLIAGLAAAVIISIPYFNYRRAGELLKNGEYENAAAAYQELGSYRDASELAQEAYYQKAMQELSNKHWEIAAGIFDSLGTYKNSAAKVLECTYQKAEDLQEQARYQDARMLFLSLEGYSDSKTRAAECLYLEAEDYLFEGEYEKAADEFALVPDYRDAALRSNQSRYQQAMELKQQTKYEDAKAVFEQLGNYSDSAEQVRECQELLIAAEEAALEMIPGGSSVEVDAELETEPLPESEPEIESPWQIVITVNATHETLEDDWAAVEATYQTDGAYHAVYHIQVKGSETGEETLRVRYEITYEDGTVKAENWDGRWRVGNVYRLEDTSSAKPTSIVFYRRDIEQPYRVSAAYLR